MAQAMSSATSFRPVDPAELKMTAEPQAPGASAIILYRELYRDDVGGTSHTDNYYRIKILSEEGRKYANVEIPYYGGNRGDIIGIHARTIRPDGSIVDFDGEVFTKSLVKGRWFKYQAKTFTLPAVEVGCVVEYFYTRYMPEGMIDSEPWILSSDLFTKAAKFALKANSGSGNLRWTWENMPPGAGKPEQGPGRVIRLELANIPAFQKEELMPPADQLMARVDFIYSFGVPETDPIQFWAKVGKGWTDSLESFIGKPKSMDEAVTQIVGPNDPPEVKLRKIYMRVQQLGNTTYEARKTEEEEKRAKEKAATNVEEVWKRGYGNIRQLNRLYLALVRAAGFEAYEVWAADRSRYSFDPSSMRSDRLNQNLVLIKLNGKDIFCDPGAAFTPFGLLPWSETGVAGLQLDKKGSTWIHVMDPTPGQASTERRAQLTLSDTGDLEGKLTITFTDMEAARLRVEGRQADEAERKSYLESLVKGSIPTASEVKLTNQPDWKSSESPLVAEFDLKVPGWGAGAGHHVMVPVGLFSAHEKHLFDHASRVYPIYVSYPSKVSDDINIQIPAGWQASSVPKGWSDHENLLTYSFKAENDKEKLHISRNLSVDFILMDKIYYRAIRDFIQQVKAIDEEQFVLDAAARATK